MLALALVVCGPFSASSFATVDLDAARKSVVEGGKALEEKRFANRCKRSRALEDYFVVTKIRSEADFVQVLQGPPKSYAGIRGGSPWVGRKPARKARARGMPEI